MLNRRGLLAVAPLLAGCTLPALVPAGDSTTRRRPVPSATAATLDPDNRIPLPELHLSLLAPKGLSLTRSTRESYPSYVGWLHVYALPPSAPTDTRAINGSHGEYHQPAEIADASDLTTSSVPYGSLTVLNRVYSEYTNVKTDYTDCLGFLTWQRPPADDQPVVVLGMYRLALRTDARAVLQSVAETIRPF